MNPLSKSFFEKNTIRIAKNLLGKYIKHKNMIGKIVETEAYLHDDPASHSFNGKTKRNTPMFDKPGTAYVYFTYGMYHCFNIVTNKKNIGEAVLIRALEPIKGIKQMQKNRGRDDNLCNGPAKLVIAIGITKKHNGVDLLNKNSSIKIFDNKENFEIVQTKRIGISKGKSLPHRFYVKNSKWVSMK